MGIFLHILAYWTVICLFAVFVGISLANRIPAEAKEDDSALGRIKPPLPPYEEPDQLRKQREGYVARRDPVVLAIQRERAELQAVRGGK
jgi:hypothetical protein